MEYVQMTLNDWMSIKSELEQELRNAAAGFVRIGYLLRRAEESEGYKNDGYDTLTEWAQDNYGLTPSQVSRFKAINKRYSIDGYSNQLKLEYANYGQSKLTEMLTLSDEALEMVSPEMKRDDIREIKAFERQAPKEEPVQEEKNQWIIEYINAKGLESLKDSKAFQENNLRGMIEEVIPSGAGTFRYKTTMVSMLQDRILVKVFPKPPETMDWSDFFVVVREELFRRAEEKVYEDVLKMPEEEHEMPKEEQKMPKEEQKMPEDVRNVRTEEQAAGVPEPEKAIAPAQSETEESTVTYSENQDSTITESEPEQVEIDEILPAPAGTDRLTELKDKFGEALATLRIQLDSNNFENMEIVIRRLETLRVRLISAKEEKGE